MTWTRVFLCLLLSVGVVTLFDRSGDLLFAEEGNTSAPTEEADGFDLESLDDELFEGLDDGEDVQFGPDPKSGEEDELGEEADHATRIGHLMRRVEQLLQERDLSQPTRDDQKEIVRQLEEWLKELEQQKKQQQQKPQPNAQSKPGEQGKRDAPKQPGQGSQPGQAGTTPNSGQGDQESGNQGDSDERLRNMKLEKIEFDQLRDSVEEFWGDLPERERQLLLQMADVELLPEYAPLIRRYFRRLAEDKRDRP